MGSLAKKIAALSVRSKTDAKLREKKRKDDAKRAHERAMLRAQTPDGMSPGKKAKLLAAQAKLHDDPRHKRLVEEASLEKRVQQVKREHHLGHVSPPVFMGEPIAPKDVPESIAQRLNRQKRERELKMTQERITTAGLAAFANQREVTAEQAAELPRIADATEAQFGEQLKAMLARVQEPKEESNVIEAGSIERTGDADRGAGTGGDSASAPAGQAQDVIGGNVCGSSKRARGNARGSAGHARRTRGAR
jgi:hypothetical protein